MTVNAFISQARIHKGFKDPIIVLEDGYMRHTEALILKDVTTASIGGPLNYNGTIAAEGAAALEWLSEVTRNGMLFDFVRVLPYTKPFKSPTVMLDYGHAYFIPARTPDGKSVKSVHSK